MEPVELCVLKLTFKSVSILVSKQYFHGVSLLLNKQDSREAACRSRCLLGNFHLAPYSHRCFSALETEVAKVQKLTPYLDNSKAK
jgi:hypothetical protein